jgi:hypothetical protein
MSLSRYRIKGAITTRGMKLAGHVARAVYVCVCVCVYVHVCVYGKYMCREFNVQLRPLNHAVSGPGSCTSANVLSLKTLLIHSIAIDEKWFLTVKNLETM